MAMVTVWTFDVPGQPTERPGLRKAATQAAIDRLGLVRRDDSLNVDERLLDIYGLTREEYLTFRVWVPHAQVFAGYSVDGQRLQVMAGEYDARLTIREVNAIVGAVPCVQLVNGDSRGGDLWIKIEEYDELENFPDVENPQHLDVRGSRVTAPEEL
ncbi:hypothetical protein [Burkholderia ubonensis]|uniref:hypothetical protein n=1 Tax=Burkholderia ubonensis TaxID=101571 RepID=UPI0012FA7FCF|nr:hypothetical protein [Burkholderia ubonensis]